MTEATKLRRLLLGRKAMTNLYNIVKSRDIIFINIGPVMKAMAFPLVMYGSESWTKRRLSAEELMFLNCGGGEDS